MVDAEDYHSGRLSSQPESADYADWIGRLDTPSSVPFKDYVPRIQPMPFRKLTLLLFAFLALSATGRAEEHGGPPSLKIGAVAPDFCLPGIDGQTHCLKDYASSRILVLIFTCDHCPMAQLYE